MCNMFLKTCSQLVRLVLLTSIGWLSLSGCGGGGGNPVAPGIQITPDTTYGQQGLTSFVLEASQGDVRSAVLQADGKLIVAGWRQTAPLPPSIYGGYAAQQVLVRRFHGDGSVDTTFGTGGEVRFNVKGSDTVADVKLQADGKILLAVKAIEPCLITDFVLSAGMCMNDRGASAEAVSAVVRLTASGALDASFGTAGVVQAPTSTGGLALAVQDDSKILLLRTVSVGRARVFGSMLTRYLPDGSVDSSFNQGQPLTSRCAADGQVLLIQADGKIVTGGTENAWYADPTASPGFCLERTLTNGSQDTGFRAVNLWTNVGSNVDLHALTTLPNGGLLAVGRVCDRSTCGGLAVHFSADGAVDTTFGDAGVGRIMVDPGFQLNGYVAMSSGDLMFMGYRVLGGATGLSSLYQPLWARLDFNGQPARGFGVNGVLTGTTDPRMPRNVLRDTRGRWLVVNRTPLPDGNQAGVVMRLVGEAY